MHTSGFIKMETYIRHYTVDIFEKYIYLAAARKEKTLGIISFQYFLKWFAVYYHIFIVFKEDLC